MYERLKAMHADGRLDAAGLDRAVTRGWITAAQRDEILGGAA